MKRSLYITLIILIATTGLWAQDKIVKAHERTVMEAPIIGKITTDKFTFISDCQVMEDREMKFHNFFARLVSDDPKSRDVTVTDLCKERVTTIDHENETYHHKSFAEVREDEADDESDVTIRDEDDDPAIITRTVSRDKEEVNGFKSRRVTTMISSSDGDNPLIVEEWYTRKVPGLEKRKNMLDRVDKALNRENGIHHGVPDFIDVFFDAIEADQELEEVPGFIVKAQIRLEDDDGDAIFFMEYNLSEIEMIQGNKKPFGIPREFDLVE